MAKPKNPDRVVSLRLSVNVSLDDVGLNRLYRDLIDIENASAALPPLQIHILKRRHLLKILHSYCDDKGQANHIPIVSLKQSEPLAVKTVEISQNEIQAVGTDVKVSPADSKPEQLQKANQADANIMDALGISGFKSK